ncbi:MAG: anhydro-N-acetylmuramic acid kinase [Cyanobacteria bacterium CRU_2_1]|nr:anhydro-N-acetylmuramic acid kinase [Cyanobacteria bacterium RU_5_0]NJR59475.1 anhydro-N-acetylmuramic acid kinase [Cyanobacteria bacterium CRU_2_1]
MTRVIGLISGTSVDGIDAALVEVSGTTFDLTVELLAGITYPYPEALRSRILSVCAGAPLSMAEFAALDDAIAHTFVQAALTIQTGHPPADLIGSHGQTLYHRPIQKDEDGGMKDKTATHSSSCILHPSSLGYSLQLGRGSLIAHLTNIPTVSNFRAADIAAGGQGAPLVAAIDVCLLSHSTYSRCIQNIGGISNLTYLPALKNGEMGEMEDRGDGEMRSQSSTISHLPPEHPQISSLPPFLPSPPLFPPSKIIGWDTGPGNVLLDLAVQRLSGGTRLYDKDGAWAAQGTPCQSLVQQWLQMEFFQQLPPKSTGRELFGQSYLDRCLQDAAQHNLSEADFLATLTELTAASIAHSYHTFLPQMPDQVLLCGGGSRNAYLKQRLQVNLKPALVSTTDQVGLNVDFKEAIAFAVLAYWRSLKIPGNLPEVTGARQAVLLGEFHLVA